MSNWPIVRVADLVRIKHGHAFPGSDFSSDAAHPTLVTPGNFAIGGGFIQANQKTFAGDYPSEFVLSPDSVIVTMTDLSKLGDTLGYSAVVPSEGTYLHNQRIGLVEPAEDERVDLLFLNYLFRTPQYRAHVLGSATGSTVRHTSPSRIGDYAFRLPPLDEQRRIAGLLGSLDGLIDTNERLSTTCAELRRTIVRDSITEATDQLPLSSVARFVNGRNFTRVASGVGRPIVRTPEVRAGVSGSTLRSDTEATEDNLATAGDILMVWSGSLMLGRWSGEDALVNQHIFKVIPNGWPDWLVYGWLERQLPWFLSLAADKATTMGHIQRAHLEAAVPIPTAGEIERLGDQVDPLWRAELALAQECADLRRVRNELLPLLMSGLVRVTEVREIEA